MCTLPAPCAPAGREEILYLVEEKANFVRDETLDAFGMEVEMEPDTKTLRVSGGSPSHSFRL